VWRLRSQEWRSLRLLNGSTAYYYYYYFLKPTSTKPRAEKPG